MKMNVSQASPQLCYHLPLGCLVLAAEAGLLTGDPEKRLTLAALSPSTASHPCCQTTVGGSICLALVLPLSSEILSQEVCDAAQHLSFKRFSE